MIPNAASPTTHEVLFLFSAPQGWLAEVKRLDLPADTPKQLVYHWLWFAAEAITSLQFRSMSPPTATSSRQERCFEEASLWFDDLVGELRWHGGESVALSVEVERTLPAALNRRVQAHFGI